MTKKSVLKREHQNIIKRARNRVIRSKVHTAKLRLIEAINKKDREDVDKRFRTFMSEVDKAVKRGVFHRNKGARLKSRANKAIKTAFVEQPKVESVKNNQE